MDDLPRFLNEIGKYYYVFNTEDNEGAINITLVKDTQTDYYRAFDIIRYAFKTNRVLSKHQKFYLQVNNISIVISFIFMDKYICLREQVLKNLLMSLNSDKYKDYTPVGGIAYDGTAYLILLFRTSRASRPPVSIDPLPLNKITKPSNNYVA